MKMKIVSAHGATLFITLCLSFLTSFNIISNPIDQLKALLTKENLSAVREKGENSYYETIEYKEYRYYKDVIPLSTMETIKIDHDIDEALPKIISVSNPETLEKLQKFLGETEFTINGQKLLRKDITTVLVPRNKPINVGITIKHIISLIGGTANTTFLKILDFLPIHINYAFPIKNSGQEISLTELIFQQQELINFIYEQSRQAFSVTKVLSFVKKYVNLDWSNIGLGVKFTLPTVSDDEAVNA